MSRRLTYKRNSLRTGRWLVNVLDERVGNAKQWNYKCKDTIWEMGGAIMSNVSLSCFYSPFQQMPKAGNTEEHNYAIVFFELCRRCAGPSVIWLTRDDAILWSKNQVYHDCVSTAQSLRWYVEAAETQIKFHKYLATCNDNQCWQEYWHLTAVRAAPSR